MPWPKDGVDVLEAENIHKGSLKKDDNCRCLVGWLQYWFGYASQEYWYVLRIAHQITGTTAFLGAWNDSPKRLKAEIARTINKVTATAGFVVNNPETKNI